MSDQLTLIDGIAPNPNAKPFRRSARHLRAIKQFSLMRGLIVQISPHPIYIFKEKESGKIQEHHLDTVLAFYDQWRKELSQDRKRNRGGRKR
jgi:hypothetical protein